MKAFYAAGLSATALALAATPIPALAASDAELKQLRDELRALREVYEARIDALQQRLQRVEVQAAEPANSKGTQPVAAAATAQPGAPSLQMSLILAGTHGSFSRNPDDYAITGFIPRGNDRSPGTRGFSLGESELRLSGNVDPNFRGELTVALEGDNKLSVEEAFVQTLALGQGMTAKAGRFLSGIGYLNSQHRHTWDFVDEPLVYRALWDTQLGEDGVQLKWVAPTETFVELGAEVGRGRAFPGTDRNKNGAGAGALFAHVGGDIGTSQSWQAGVSLHRTTRTNASLENEQDPAGNLVTNRFNGRSLTRGADFVWKYAGTGGTGVKVQGEYFRRSENGRLAYDVDNQNIEDSFSVARSGWYLQGVYQFSPRWRAGLRHDRLDPGSAALGDLLAGNVVADPGYRPTRNTVMADYSFSEFSRLRLQYARDRSQQGVTDHQWLVQYMMSLGAHGAHRY